MTVAKRKPAGWRKIPITLIEGLDSFGVGPTPQQYSPTALQGTVLPCYGSAAYLDQTLLADWADEGNIVLGRGFDWGRAFSLRRAGWLLAKMSPRSLFLVPLDSSSSRLHS